MDDFLKLKKFEKTTKELRDIMEDLLIQVVYGISDIHQVGLMHRDIKGCLWFDFCRNSIFK